MIHKPVSSAETSRPAFGRQATSGGRARKTENNLAAAGLYGKKQASVMTRAARGLGSAGNPAVPVARPRPQQKNQHFRRFLSRSRSRHLGLDVVGGPMAGG